MAYQLDISQYYPQPAIFEDWVDEALTSVEEFWGFPFSSANESQVYSTPTWEEKYLLPMSMESALAGVVGIQSVPEVQPTMCSSSLTLQWCHKKGKTKPQQFWVYCEGSQQNYAKISFQAEGITWGPKSAFMQLIDFPQSIVLVENASLDEVVGVTFNSQESGPVLRNYSKRNLCPLDTWEIHLSIELVEDVTFPVHPQQGRASAVTIDKKVKQMDDPSSLISYLASFTFKNRSEGWFRLNTTLSYGGIVLSAGQSDVFMFNNPRMKKLKEFRDYAPSQIKIMQVYALSDHRSKEAENCWEATAMSVGLSMPKLKSSGVLFPSPLKRKMKPSGNSRGSPTKKRKL